MASDLIFGQGPLAIIPTLNLITQLIHDRRTRDQHGCFFLEGVRHFVAASDSGVRIEAIVYSERLLIAPLARKLVRQHKRAGVPTIRISPEQFRSISRTPRAAGVGAIVRQQIMQLPCMPVAAPACWVALSQVRSPGNLGTLIRTAVATGATGFMVLGNQIDPFDPRVVRASMGAVFRQQFIRTNLAALQAWAQHSQIHIIGAAPDGEVVYTNASYQAPLVLILGEERAGLTREQRRMCDQLVRIPMLPGTDSLNLGVAGSLLLYEIQRGLDRGA